MLKDSKNLSIRMAGGAEGWDRPFEEPARLPNGKELVILRNAADYITEVSKTEQDALPGL